MRVIFVCYANLCRSPMAEAVFRRLVVEAGLAGAVSMDSCGTSALRAGEMPAPMTMKVLADNGIRDYVHVSRPITSRDLAEADYLVAMDEQVAADIRAVGEPRGAVVRLLDFAPQIATRDVPDPYYDLTGHAYKTVYKLVDLGCRGLLEHIAKALA